MSSSVILEDGTVENTSVGTSQPSQLPADSVCGQAQAAAQDLLAATEATLVEGE